MKIGLIYSRLHPVIRPEAFAHRGEELGFDSVWATEGLANQLANLDPVVTMGALAQGCETLTVGSCVILLPLRNPAILSKEIASLDILSGGRIVFGFGVGASPISNPADFRACGIDPRERGARCDEGLDVMVKLWRSQTVDHHGRFHHFDDIMIRPAPVQHPHPPIWAGGNAEGMLRRAGRICDGFIPWGTGPDGYAELWERVCHHARSYGREPAKITRAVLLHCTMAGSRAEGHALLERTLTERYGTPVSIPDDGAHMLGDADECVRVLRSYHDAGIEHVVINTARRVDEVLAQIERFAVEVLPQVASTSQLQISSN